MTVGHDKSAWAQDKRNGAYRHGGYTQEAVAASQYVKAMVKLSKPTLDEIA